MACPGSLASPSPLMDARSSGYLISKRTDTQTVNASSSSLTYSPASGAWSPAVLSRDSCATEAESTISFNASVSLVFVGTSLSVNIIKDTNGAPYNVTLDGNVNSYNSYATSQQCTSDFQATGLTSTEHTVIVAHSGSSVDAAAGDSTLYFVSFVYTPSINLQQGPSTPAIGPIVGGVIGGIVALFICGLLWWLLRRRKAQVDKEKVAAATTYEPYEPAFVIPQDPAHETIDGRPSLSVPPQPARTKGAEAASSSRYVRSSPWASLTSNNHSRPNVAGSSRAQSGLDSSQSPTESLRPTSMSQSQYPPSSEYPESSGGLTATQPLLPNPSSRSRVPPPSTVGESVLIDESDYIAPPSYSPPSNQPRTSVQPGGREKATYEGPEDSGGSSTNWLSPATTSRALPTGSSTVSHGTSQGLSTADIDSIARRVVEFMRAPASSTGSEVSSSDMTNPQVQQAVRVLLANEDTRPPVETPRPKTPNSGSQV